MEELVSRAQAGDPAAQEELLRLLRPQLRQWAEQTLNERYSARVDASDVAQDALLGVWQKIQQFLGSTPHEFVGWVKRGLNRDVQDAIRHATAQRRSIDGEQSLENSFGGQLPRDRLASDISTPSQQAIRREEVELLYQALGKLPPDQARAIELVQLRGLSLDRAAEEMGRSKLAVVQLIKRGVVSLRKHMPKRNQDVS